uniref:Pre-mRNA splicing Prp18-interacting factor n=1 Tax=Tanacetum cinerariifolium TaxID=118510 RepID=A0A699GWQ1_TANCI|nr:hypothetical protein [Tanacetum cinerariifolium]
MNLLNGNCIHCIYRDGKPVTCSACDGMLRGGCCLPCNLKAEKLFIRDPNAYSFNDTSNNSNYIPQPQYKNHLCNLCENNSHDGYDCQQQFLFVYEQEPSYNEDYNDNYYPHDLPSFPYCDNCGESHETFQCQPMDQNIDFFGSDQIQTPQYPDVHPPSQEISDEIINKELIECNHPTFFDDNEDHLENSSKEIVASNSNQEKEGPPQDFDIRQLIRKEWCIEVCEGQNQNIEDTIRELVEICRQKELYCMHDNVDDLIESALSSKHISINLNSQCINKEKQEVKNVVEQPAERRTHIEKSLQNFRVIHKSSTSLKNTSQISSVYAVAPILSTKEPEYSLSIGYKHPNSTPKTESDEIIKSGVEELVPILSENEVTSEDKRECDVPVCENYPICDDHSKNFSDSNNDDDISSDDDAFEDIEYIKASLPDPEIVSVEEDNDVHQEEEESNNSLTDNFSPEFKTFCDHTEETRSGNTTTHADDSLPKYDSFCFEIELDQEKLTSAVMDDISDDLTNDPLLEEADLFLAFDNSIPSGIENFGYDSEGDIRFMEELLIDDYILFPNNESSESDFDNPSFPRPPLEPPDAEFDVETNAGEEILV